MFLHSRPGVAWVGVAVLLVTVSTAFVWWRYHHARSALQERLATISIPTIPSEAPEKKSDFLLLVYGDKPAPGLGAWAEAHRMDYFAQNITKPWDLILAFLERYEYVAAVSSRLTVFNRACTLEKVLRAAGDAELIFVRDEFLPGQINLDVVLVRNGDWARFKLHELIKAGTQDLPTEQLLEPAYIGTLAAHTFTDFRKHLDKGVPYLAPQLCVFHEHALASTQSELFRYVQHIKAPAQPVFPWAPLQHEEYVQLTVEPPALDKLETRDDKASLIPKVLFQTLETSVVTHALRDCALQTQRLNPESTYVYFTAYDCRQFIRRYYPHCLEAYDTLLPGAYKADLWRYCVLHRYGGIYLDIGVLPYVGFRSVLAADTDFFSSVDLAPMDLYQALLGARVGHPALQLAIEECVENVKQQTYGTGCLQLTGPSVMGRALNRFLGRLPDDNLHNVSGKFGLQLLRWDSFKSVKDLVWNDTRVACHKYTKLLSTDAAKAEQKRWLVLTGKPHYGVLYARKQVYTRKLFQVQRK